LKSNSGQGAHRENKHRLFDKKKRESAYDVVKNRLHPDIACKGEESKKKRCAKNPGKGVRERRVREGD